MAEKYSSNSKIERRRKRKSRWAPEGESPEGTNVLLTNRNSSITTTPLLNISRSDPALIQYAIQSFGSANLSEEDWKKAEDHYKVSPKCFSFFLSLSLTQYMFKHIYQETFALLKNLVPVDLISLIFQVLA